VKEPKQLTQKRKGAKSRKGEVHSLLCDLCDFAPLRETALSVHGLIHTFSGKRGRGDRVRGIFKAAKHPHLFVTELQILRPKQGAPE
jgi:hypothetical protein